MIYCMLRRLTRNNESPLHKGPMDKPEFSQGFYFRGGVFSVITVIHLQSGWSPFQSKFPREAHFWSDSCLVNTESERKPFRLVWSRGQRVCDELPPFSLQNLLTSEPEILPSPWDSAGYTWKSSHPSLLTHTHLFYIVIKMTLCLGGVLLTSLSECKWSWVPESGVCGFYVTLFFNIP